MRQESILIESETFDFQALQSEGRPGSPPGSSASSHYRSVSTESVEPPPPPVTGPDIIVTASLSSASEASIGFLSLGWTNLNGGGGTVPGGWRPNNPVPQPTPRENTVSTAIEHLRVNGRLAQSDLEQMDALGIKLSEVLRPGIYQAEFNVINAGILGTAGEHREWVRVFADGHSELLTAGVGANGELDLRQTQFEGDVHGLKHTSGEIRFFAVAPTIENSQLADERWGRMVQEEQKQDARQLNYHFLAQNSNSAFNTVGKAGGVLGHEDGGNYAAASGLNLNDVDPNFQPSKLTGTGASISGTESNDNLAGTAADGSIYGNGGDDQIAAYAMGDYIDGGSGSDTINLLGGTALGGDGADVITAMGTASVSLFGNLDADTLRGGGVGDILDGGLGDDTIYGGAGDDQVEGGEGIDNLFGEGGADLITAGEGNDVVQGGDGDDILMGETGNDSLDGGDGSDAISGALGVDYIYGRAGDDFIRPGMGADHIWGGTGADTIVINYNGYVGINTGDSYVMHRPMSDGGTLNEADTIYDFEPGVDKIDLTSFSMYDGQPDLGASNLTIRETATGTFVGWMLPNHGAYGYDGEVMLLNTFGVTTSDFLL